MCTLRPLMFSIILDMQIESQAIEAARMLEQFEGSVAALRDIERQYQLLQVGWHRALMWLVLLSTAHVHGRAVASTDTLCWQPTRLACRCTFTPITTKIQQTNCRHVSEGLTNPHKAHLSTAQPAVLGLLILYLPLLMLLPVSYFH